MKKLVLFMLIAGIVLLSACSLPVGKTPDGTVDKAVEDDVPEGIKDIEKQDLKEPQGQIESKKEETGEVRKADVMDRLTVTLYYQDREGSVVPVTRRIVKQEGIARAAVSSIIDSSLNREDIEYFGLYPVLPKGTEILGINIKEGVATIDFNNKLLDYDNETSGRNIISSVVYTLTEFNTINGVRILVNGYEKGKLKYGTDISGVLNRNNTLVNSGRINLQEGSKKLDIYLYKNIKENSAYLLPVSVEYSNIEDGTIPGKVVELLESNNVADEKMYSEIPDGTELLGCSVKSGILTLDFNDSVLNYGGSAKEQGILSQVLYSMKQVEGVDRVRILVDGKTVELPEGTDVSKAIPIPGVINDVIDK